MKSSPSTVTAAMPPGRNTRASSRAHASCASADRWENTLKATTTSMQPVARIVGGTGVTVMALMPGRLTLTSAVISGSTSAAKRRSGAT